MRPFDHDYAEEILARIERIPADATPAWGGMTRDRLITHIADAVRYSMGKSGRVPFVGNWFSTRIIGPLIANGILPMPKNVKAPRLAEKSMGKTHCDLEQLQAVLDEYLSAVQSGDLNPPPHPYFGELGIDGWAKIHVVHIEHHLKQFGV